MLRLVMVNPLPINSPPNSKPSSQPQSRNPSNPDISHHPDISHQKHNMTSHAGNAEYSHADPSAYGASPPRGVLSKSTPELSGRPSYADGRPSQSGRAYGEQRDPRGEEGRPSQSGYSDPRLEGRPSQGGYGDQRGMEQRPSRAGGGAAGGGAYGDHYGDQLDRRPSRAGAGPYSDQQGRIHGGYSTPDVSSRYPDDGRSRPAGNPSDAFHQPGGKRPLVQAAEAAAKAREQGISAPVVNVDAAASMSPLSAQNRITSTAQSPTNWQTTPSGGGRVLPMDLKQQLTQFQLDGFAKKYFAEHRRGIFRRRVPVEKMMVYQKDSLKTPLMVLNKTMHRDALKCFKSIQKIMSSKPQNCVADVQQLLDKGIVHGELRDEIYVGICKQLTRNPNGDSVFRGWLLLCVVSIAFPPSKNFEDYLKSFVQQHMNEHENQVDVLAKHCMKKLLRICKTGPRGKTPTAQEIERAQEAPFSQNLFGETLEDIMKMELEINPNAEMPRIMKFLADAILHLNGARTEGIFRVPGDADMVTDLRCRIEKGVYDYSGITDPNVPSSLLKLWLRDLADPLIPTDYYMSCIKVGQRENEASLNELGPAAYALVDTLPEYNRRVVYYMIQFLRVMADPTNQTYTKMTIGNIAMVWAPNFLRCPSDNPTTIFENTK
ncbi:hypothetical protein HK097_002390 [Rhizophlyctis rosea]|uniref:Rho GTPase-activating protein 39 n=1 Tax=Rhizophlyctis rosea TaxID=64517 RepID=A0AAD5SFI8_9FUNG|nr:hypothetical protein HK097_002390 [Rhizophlyctis rosea]